MSLTKTNLLRLDNRYFKAFIAVAEYKSFTLAADKADMAQSVVSQHIAKLEHQLNNQLFIRPPKPNAEVVLTDAGHVLHRFVHQYLDSVSTLLTDIAKREDALEGPVLFAVTPCFILSPYFARILAKSRQLYKLEFKVNVTLNHHVYDAVLNGRLHFGITTEKIDNPSLQYERIGTEETVAVAASSHDEWHINNDIMNQRFVVYPGMDAYANPWLRHHLRECTRITTRSFCNLCEIDTLEGAIQLVKAGYGISFFPRFCIDVLLKNRSLSIIGSDHKEPLRLPLYLVYLKAIALPQRAITVIDLFRELAADNQSP